MLFSKTGSDALYTTDSSVRDCVLKHQALPPQFALRNDMPEPSDTHRVLAYVGYFVASHDPTWQGYLCDVMKYDLGYQPQRYRWFDAIVADVAADIVPSLHHSSHDVSSPLRIHIMVIRNIILHHLFAAPLSDKKTLERKLHTLTHTAMHLGLILRHADESMLATYRQEAHGCALLYQHLMRACDQVKEQPIGFVRSFFKAAQHTVDYDLPLWNHTPFASLAQTLPDKVASYSDTPDALWNMVHKTTQTLARAMRSDDEHDAEAPNDDASITERTQKETHDSLLGAITALATEIKEEAIAIARDILDKLRLQYAEMTLDQVLSVGDLPIMKDLVDGMHKVADTFRHHVSYALRADPSLAEDSSVSEAQSILGVFSYLRAQQEIQRLESFFITLQQQGKIKRVAELRTELERKRKEIQTMPHEWKQSAHLQQSIGTLLTKVETGLNTVVTRMQNQTRQDTMMMPTNNAILRTQQSSRTIDMNNDGAIDATERQQAEASEKAAKQQQQLQIQAAQQQRQQAGAVHRPTGTQQQEQQKKQAQDRQRQVTLDTTAQEMLQAARQRRELERQQRQEQRQTNQQKEQGSNSRSRDRASQRIRQQMRQDAVAVQQRDQTRKEQQRIDREQQQKDGTKDHAMAKLLDADSLKGIHNSLKPAQGKEDVPNTLQPRSAARTVKEMSEQRTGQTKDTSAPDKKQSTSIQYDQTKQDPNVLVPAVHASSPTTKNQIIR